MIILQYREIANHYVIHIIIMLYVIIPQKKKKNKGIKNTKKQKDRVDTISERTLGVVRATWVKRN